MSDQMRVLVACEYSGRVRNAFAARGHDAWSCDILPTESVGNHIQDDVLGVLDDGWDLMIAHPPCTHLAVSGSRHFKNKVESQNSALNFVRALMKAPIHMIAIENPISVISTKIREPDQIVQPYWFGHPLQKSTCLWLKNLPPLRPTNTVRPKYSKSKSGRYYSKWFLDTSKLPKSKRGHIRSLTFEGVANAMADQWGVLPVGWTYGLGLR